MNQRKYKLKPGRHQFAPGSHAVHENDHMSDDEIEWYLQKYPHIVLLLEEIPGVTDVTTNEGEMQPIAENAQYVPYEECVTYANH